MPVDVHVYAGLPVGASGDDAYDLRRKLDRAEVVVVGSRWAGGGVGSSFNGAVVVDTVYEASSTRDAHRVVEVVAAVLLREGYTVSPAGSALVVPEAPEQQEPEPGRATISVIAPVGTS